MLSATPKSVPPKIKFLFVRASTFVSSQYLSNYYRYIEMIYYKCLPTRDDLPSATTRNLLARSTAHLLVKGQKTCFRLRFITLLRIKTRSNLAQMFSLYYRPLHMAISGKECSFHWDCFCLVFNGYITKLKPFTHTLECFFPYLHKSCTIRGQLCYLYFLIEKTKNGKIFVRHVLKCHNCLYASLLLVFLLFLPSYSCWFDTRLSGLSKVIKYLPFSLYSAISFMFYMLVVSMLLHAALSCRWVGFWQRVFVYSYGNKCEVGAS